MFTETSPVYRYGAKVKREQDCASSVDPERLKFHDKIVNPSAAQTTSTRFLHSSYSVKDVEIEKGFRLKIVSLDVHRPALLGVERAADQVLCRYSKYEFSS